MNGGSSRIVQSATLVALLFIAGLLYFIWRDTRLQGTKDPETSAVRATKQEQARSRRPTKTRQAERRRGQTEKPAELLPPPPEMPPVLELPRQQAATRAFTLASGTVVTIRLVDAISSERNHPGDSFQAVLDEPLHTEGVLLAERGANVFGRVVQAEQAGRVAGVAELALELDRIRTLGGELPAASDLFMERAPTSRRKDALTVGIPAGIGAVLGGIFGGGKGAGIGAAAGGAAGTGAVLATRGRPVNFPPETRMDFRLRAPITIVLEESTIRPQPQQEEGGPPTLRRR